MPTPLYETFAEAAAAATAAGVGAADPLTQPLAAARERQDAYFAYFNRDLSFDGTVSDHAIDGPAGPFTLRLVRPAGAAAVADAAPVNAPVIVFVRGAGWWAGALDSHQRTMLQLAQESGCCVVGIDYHRTPEQHYPVQRDEILLALAWLAADGAAHGLDATRTVLFGESAGATLCLSTALALRDAARPPPRGLVLFYANAGGPKPTTRAYSKWVWHQYLGHDGGSSDPGAVPLQADFAGLPPMWLGVGEDDPLLEDTLTLAERLTAARVPFELVRCPGMPHGFVMWSGTLAPARAALQRAALAAAALLRDVR